MTETEKRILNVLKYDWRWPEGGNSWKSFDKLAETLNISVKEAKEATHSLAEEGYVRYGTARDMDYRLHGSGYFLTQKGEYYE